MQSRTWRRCAKKLAELPCCTTNKSGTANGDPINIVVVGRGLDALFSFIGREWKLDQPFDLHSNLPDNPRLPFPQRISQRPGQSVAYLRTSTGRRITEGPQHD
jgi:hypothetical protein